HSSEKGASTAPRRAARARSRASAARRPGSSPGTPATWRASNPRERVGAGSPGTGRRLRIATAASGPRSASHVPPATRSRPPTTRAGNFGIRVTNVGVVGNAFYAAGRSNDPSFEFPIHSGHEALNHADLWVGALDQNGDSHVSGGPLLEWRPTLDPADRVREA